uniref:SAM domain-containing protein n=1 Tax=Entomoneis paludosa TaxID=265537 RepID=A0A7S2Y3L6_9STRA
MKDVKDFDIDDVCLWVFSIGLGSKTEAFRENAVDGAMLLTLGAEDFTELGLSNLQAKKVLSSLEKTQEMASGGGGADVTALQQENEALKAKVAELEAQLASKSAPPPPKPAATTSKPPPPQQQKPKNEHHVIKGAARGTAKGAVLGAVAGAIAGGTSPNNTIPVAGWWDEGVVTPCFFVVLHSFSFLLLDAGKGAKIGAATGATAGGMRGMAQRRQARRGW